MSDPKPTLAEAIWASSRADESTISYIGANHVAAGALDWFADYVQRDDVVEAVAQTLINEGAAPRNSIHSWRCEDHDQYGPCNCVKAVADAALAALVETMRQTPDATTADGDAPTQRPHAPAPIVGELPTCTCGRTFWSWRAQGIHETQANHRIERGEGDE